MIYEYSLEEEKDRIVNSKTKEYFNEVYSSYQLGNYRSSLVMLWSVIVCDVIYKLKDLESLYNDQNAKSILSEFNQKYADKSKSSEWELKLLEEVFKKTLIIDVGTMETIRHIQQYRHISAHPVLETTGYSLYIPNKDLCRGLILASLLGLLTKPSFFTKKIFDDFLQDIAQNKEILISEDQIRTYLEAKYMKYLQKAVQLEFIKSLWKLVFKLDDTKCKENRSINRRVLIVLTSNCVTDLILDIEKEQQYYAINISVDTKKRASAVYLYFNTFPRLFQVLRDDAKTLIRGVENTYIHTLLLSRFLYSNWEEFETNIINSISNPEMITQLKAASEEEFNLLFDFFKVNMKLSILYKAFFTIYGKSSDFNDADQNFIKFVLPYIPEMTLEDLKYVMELSCKNSQTYARSRASVDHKKIKEKVLLINPEFDFTEYKLFVRCIDD